MDSAAATSLQTWETYYVLLGTAAATLLGLVFVALSFGSGDIFAERTSIVFNIFVDPVYHLFFSALIIAVLAVIPVQSSLSLAICLIVLVLYNSLDHIKNVRVAMSKRQILNLRARVNNVILPIVCSVLIFLSAIMLAFSIPNALTLLAATSLFTLVLEIVNTWQIMTWIIEQKNKPFDEKKS